MTHAELLAAIQLELSTGSVRLFRAQAGVAWQGNVVEHTATKLVLANPRAVRLGPEGMSDLIGWKRQNFYTYPATLSGQDAAVFVAIEVKTGTGRPTREQRAFLELVKTHGGLAGVARSVEDAREIMGL